MLSNRFLMVPVLSSAAKIPLPRQAIFSTVLNSSSCNIERSLAIVMGLGVSSFFVKISSFCLSFYAKKPHRQISTCTPKRETHCHKSRYRYHHQDLPHPLH